MDLPSAGSKRGPADSNDASAAKRPKKTASHDVAADLRARQNLYGAFRFVEKLKKAKAYEACKAEIPEALVEVAADAGIDASDRLCALQSLLRLGSLVPRNIRSILRTRLSDLGPCSEIAELSAAFEDVSNFTKSKEKRPRKEKVDSNLKPAPKAGIEKKKREGGKMELVAGREKESTNKPVYYARRTLGPPRESEDRSSSSSSSSSLSSSSSSSSSSSLESVHEGTNEDDEDEEEEEEDDDDDDDDEGGGEVDLAALLEAAEKKSKDALEELPWVANKSAAQDVLVAAIPRLAAIIPTQRFFGMWQWDVEDLMPEDEGGAEEEEDLDELEEAEIREEEEGKFITEKMASVFQKLLGNARTEREKNDICRAFYDNKVVEKLTPWCKVSSVFYFVRRLLREGLERAFIHGEGMIWLCSIAMRNEEVATYVSECWLFAKEQYERDAIVTAFGEALSAQWSPLLCNRLPTLFRVRGAKSLFIYGMMYMLRRCNAAGPSCRCFQYSIHRLSMIHALELCFRRLPTRSLPSAQMEVARDRGIEAVVAVASIEDEGDRCSREMKAHLRALLKSLAAQNPVVKSSFVDAGVIPLLVKWGEGSSLGTLVSGHFEAAMALAKVPSGIELVCEEGSSSAILTLLACEATRDQTSQFICGSERAVNVLVNKTPIARAPHAASVLAKCPELYQHLFGLLRENDDDDDEEEEEEEVKRERRFSDPQEVGSVEFVMEENEDAKFEEERERRYREDRGWTISEEDMQSREDRLCCIFEQLAEQDGKFCNALVEHTPVFVNLLRKKRCFEAAKVLGKIAQVSSDAFERSGALKALVGRFPSSRVQVALAQYALSGLSSQQNILASFPPSRWTVLLRCPEPSLAKATLQLVLAMIPSLTPEQRLQFLEEARLLAAMGDPEIVRMMDRMIEKIGSDDKPDRTAAVKDKIHEI